MKTLENATIENAKNTTVAFHIGRGGHFHNAGHLSFICENKIGKYTDDLFLQYENTSDVLKKLSDENDDFNDSDFLDMLTDAENSNDTTSIEEKYNMSAGELGELVYFDGGQNPVGLTYNEEQSGIGCINIDNDYNTTYTCRLSDCSEDEFRAIRKASEFDWLDSDLQDYIKNALDEEEEETEEEY